MRKLIVPILVVLLLAGCAAEPVFEQVTDVYAGADPMPGTVQVMVPEKVTVLASAGEYGGQLYFCDGYTLTVQTLTGGDLDRSFRQLTGYEREQLMVLQTSRDGTVCYNCAWSSAGEAGEQVGRLVLLDDGVYHYAVTVMAPADQAGALREEWDQVLNGVTLKRTDS